MTTLKTEDSTPIEWGAVFTYDHLPEWLSKGGGDIDPELVWVASVRPEGEGDWMCFEAGHLGLTKEDIAEEGNIEVRTGWGTRGCIERLPEFEGW